MFRPVWRPWTERRRSGGQAEGVDVGDRERGKVLSECTEDSRLKARRVMVSVSVDRSRREQWKRLNDRLDE